ncbi:MAG: proteasome assembly chaperone family protein [Nitrososphaeria archaeon]
MAETDIVSIIEVNPVESGKKLMMVGLPDIGLVGLIATSHIASESKMREVGYIDSELLPPIVTVHGGEVKAPIRIFEEEDMIAIISEIALAPALTINLIKGLIQWAKAKNVQTVLGATGIPTPNRLEIEKPNVLGLATTKELKRCLQNGKIQSLQEGMLVGTYAILVRECLKHKIPNITLLSESFEEFPDPGASASIVEALNRVLDKNIDVQSLIEKADEIRVRTRELMRRTQQQMKGIPIVQELPGMYR